MNVFYLHHLPTIAGSMHCDKHVGKMLIESCQLLATAHHHFDNGDAVTYRPTHKNHPSAIWVRQSRLHYDWVVELGLTLGRQFKLRYLKLHKSHQVLVDQLTQAPPAMYKLPLLWQPPPLAMPDDYKSSDHVESYRKYYASKLQTMPMVYFKGNKPPPMWLSDLWAGRTSQEAA